MKNLNLSQVRTIYFIGIGGIAMSAAASIAKQKGFEVFGSDAKELYSPAKEVLEKEGIEYFAGYSEENIKQHKDSDLFVVSAGEDESNPEVKFLVDNDIPPVSYPEFLKAISEDVIRIVVTGTHGKSTTAGLLGYILSQADDSSFMTGALIQNTGSNFYLGGGHYFVFEGDEYKSLYDDPTPKFKYYEPDIVLLNNLEFDHPDIFENLDQVKHEFSALLEDLPDDGLVIYNADDINATDVVYNQNHRSFSFSLDHDSDFKLDSFSMEKGVTRFRVINKIDPENVRTEEYTTNLVGLMNLKNCVGVIALLRSLGFQPELINNFLSLYNGVKRRFEVVSSENGITVIDDFAHHPTAVKETLRAAKEKYFSDGETGRLWAVFEPHTYSRTKATLGELVESFKDADMVLLAPMYGAREHQDKVGITDEEVLNGIKKHSESVRLVKDRADALNILKSEAKEGDVIVIMSAGTFNKLAYEFNRDN